MDIILRAALMYVFVLVMLRVTTRRIMKSATPLDMVVIFLFGGLAVPCVLGDDKSVTASVLAIATVAGLHFGLSAMRMRWPLVGRLVDGTSVVLYARGKWDKHQMMASRVTEQDVVSEMRQNGLTSLGEVDCVVVEHNGGITILPRRESADR